MNGPHDLGGQMGFGPVAPEPDEPVFHAEWEKRALGADALRRRDGRTGASTRAGTRARACHPADYYASSYYEIWIKALERLLERHGFVTEAELAAGQRARPPAPQPEARAEGRRRGRAVLARGGPCDRTRWRRRPLRAGRPRAHPQSSTRPATRACRATPAARPARIEAVQGFVFPDSNAHGKGENPQWLYTVVFDGARALGRATPTRTLTVSIDAWESYLEPRLRRLPCPARPRTSRSSPSPGRRRPSR